MTAGGADEATRNQTIKGSKKNGVTKTRDQIRDTKAKGPEEDEMTIADHYKSYLVSKAGGVFLPWPKTKR